MPVGSWLEDAFLGGRITGEAEWEMWARFEEEALLRHASPYAKWRWETASGRLPLDDLFPGPATIKVLREICREAETSWPATLARRTRLSRTTVHSAIRRLTRARIVEPVRAWDSNRTRGCRLNDDNPLASALRRVFEVEARIWGTPPRDGLFARPLAPPAAVPLAYDPFDDAWDPLDDPDDSDDSGDSDDTG